MPNEENVPAGPAPTRGRGGFEVTKRVIVLGLLIALVLIPLYMVHDMVLERYDRSQSVADEVASEWGQQQLIAGPVVTVPYVVHLQDTENGVRT